MLEEPAFSVKSKLAILVKVAGNVLFPTPDIPGPKSATEF
jgi:hypothetical protein